MRLTIALFTALLFAASPARADLFDLGNGMVYDNVQDLTWMQDLSYVSTSGFDADGRLTYTQAKGWVETLTYGGYNDWRLPEMRTLDLYRNSTDEISGVMAQLGGHSFEDSLVDYEMPASWGPFLPPTRTAFWVAPPETTACPSGCYAWMGWTQVDLSAFHWDGERPGPTAWAVRDGRARVPEPSTAAATMLGLGAYGMIRRRRARRAAAGA